MIVFFIAWTIWIKATVKNAQARGLWPKTGVAPTEEHLRRLIIADEKPLAMRLHRQIYHSSLVDAKVAIEKLAGEMGSTRSVR